MATEVIIPDFGTSVKYVTLVMWHKNVGDPVKRGDALCEIETDKATSDLEAFVEGVLLKQVVSVGEEVEIGTVIAYVGKEGESVPEEQAGVAAAVQSPVAPRAEFVQPTAETGPPRPGAPVKASPKVRKLARDLGVDLTSLAPQGRGGKITEEDVRQAAENQSDQKNPADMRRITKPTIDIPAGAVRKPMSRMRRAIAENMVTSCRNIPHFYMKTTVDMEPVMDFYRKQRPLTGCWLSDIILLAVGRAMADFPLFRSQVHGADLVEFPTANIGLVVGLDEGIVVPTVLGVDRMDIAQLAEQTRKLIKAARDGIVNNAGAATFSVSNMSGYGVEEFSAIINPPESGILAVGAVHKQPVVRKGVVDTRRMMQMTLGSDHRIIDGIVAAQFLKRLKELIEHL